MIQLFYLQIRGMCPILIGADKGDITLVKLCLRNPQTDLDLNKPNKDGKTALILAVERSSDEIVNLLLHEDFMEKINAEHWDVSS